MMSSKRIVANIVEMATIPKSVLFLRELRIRELGRALDPPVVMSGLTPDGH